MSIYSGPEIPTSGLVFCIDASNTRSYPGSGSTWSDLSGNGLNVTLYNSPTFSTDGITFNGTTQYGRTNSTLNLTSTSAITVVSVWKVPTTTVSGILYEHTANWNSVNSNYGGFGLSPNSDGNANVSNRNHNQVRGNVGYSGVNTNTPATTSFQIYTLTHDFSSAGSDETYSYINGIYQNKSSTGVGSTYTAENTASFGNDYLYLAARGGTTSFSNATISYLSIYNYKLTETNIFEIFAALRGRYGI